MVGITFRRRLKVNQLDQLCTKKEEKVNEDNEEEDEALINQPEHSLTPSTNQDTATIRVIIHIKLIALRLKCLRDQHIRQHTIYILMPIWPQAESYIQMEVMDLRHRTIYNLEKGH